MTDFHAQPGNGPLYEQVKHLIVERVVSGVWTPGDRLPSETALAREINVSQGTVRKAMDDLCHENLLVRHQGRGTFVSIHTAQRELYHFFHLAGADGIKRLPQRSDVVSNTRRRANRAEAERLQLPAAAEVIVIKRNRHLDGQPAIIETIVLPATRFVGFERETDIPNELYQRYEEIFGVTIHKVEESLCAVAATRAEAKALGIEPGAPLLEIDRTAETLEGMPVEWRLSRCDSRTHRYLNENV
ncbi:MAG: GntR family transcriptional regulator [Rhodospirillaceae bacterium]|nr:GntR family transcriptional regulator [Rhodospirillaceae bacterium]